VLALARSGQFPRRFGNVSRRVVPLATVQADRGSSAHFLAYFENTSGQPVPADLWLEADDEVALAINGQSLVETRGPRPKVPYHERVLLPPGVSELQVLYHKFRHAGGLNFVSLAGAGAPTPWTCDPAFQ
jgi:hypothetical protein